MRQTASEGKYSEGQERLSVAFELGWRGWKLAFTIGLGERVWETSIAARDLERLREVVVRARERLGLPANGRVISCYEAGRDGFWLHRWLEALKIENVVVDSSSIEVNRRARRAKTDRLDAAKLLSMLVRYDLGESKVWSVVRVPSEAQEDARHLHRELRTLKKEQTRLINRIKGLLASQGASARIGRRGLLDPLEGIRTWDGGSLPEGLRARLEREIDRHRFLHQQVLDLEAQNKKMVKDGSSAPSQEVRRLMRLRGVGRVCATIFVREFGWRQFKNRRQVGAWSCPVSVDGFRLGIPSGVPGRGAGRSPALPQHTLTVVADLSVFLS